MKVTSELKTLINEKIEAERYANFLANKNDAIAKAEEVNQSLAESKEWKALKSAIEAWTTKIDEAVAATEGIRRNMGLKYILQQEIPDAVGDDSVPPNGKEYREKANAIFAKISYARNIAEVQDVLKSNGIEF